MQLEAKSIIDLTQTISENLQVYPGDPPVEVHTVSTLENGFVLERVCMSSHCRHSLGCSVPRSYGRC